MIKLADTTLDLDVVHYLVRHLVRNVHDMIEVRAASQAYCLMSSAW